MVPSLKDSKMAEKMILKSSVRGVVEFLLRSGDIDNRKRSGSENAMQEGGRIHRMIQRRMGSEYEAEVPLSYCMDWQEYAFLLDGRADGVITREDTVTIDEIKGTYRELQKIGHAEEVHLAQARCYAAMYVLNHAMEKISLRITYCHMETEEVKYFYEHYTAAEITEWFFSLLEEYKKWLDYQVDWRKVRQASLKALQFPYSYREGQRELAGHVYRTIYHQKKLFLEAPTGVGKTLSTVFPSLKAMGEEQANRLFYLTAKTITRTVAEDCFVLLREQGLQFKTIVLTAKEKICFAEEVNCNPVDCPYAKGHWNRVNEALYELITTEPVFSREIIEEYARKYQLCPFEFGLDVSLFSDAIIGDYNYLFDPHVALKRFFAEGKKEDYIFLIDEAHNLVDRGREMYSASLRKEDFLELKKTVQPYHKKMANQLEKCNRELLGFKKITGELQVLNSIESFVMQLLRLSDTCVEYLENHEEGEVRTEVLDFYFQLSHFLLMYENKDSGYVTYTQMQEDGSFLLRLFCVDPSKQLAECMQKGRSSILFSATLLPIQYYKKLLGGEADDFEVYAPSSFSKEHRGIFVARDVTSRYRRRDIEEYRKMAIYIKQIVSAKEGNYMVFLPSYQMLQKLYDLYQEEFWEAEKEECLVQKVNMAEAEREQFLQAFRGNPELDLETIVNIPIEYEKKSLIGFCVLGGIFGEGIDLKKDSLIGAILIGTGLPLVCGERELLKQYFEDRGLDGFAYAYQYPGMNKVLQAAGRVIRTTEDIGVVALLDERFLQAGYKQLFPREWENYQICTKDTIGKEMKNFWKSFS